MIWLVFLFPLAVLGAALGFVLFLGISYGMDALSLWLFPWTSTLPPLDTLTEVSFWHWMNPWSFVTLGGQLSHPFLPRLLVGSPVAAVLNFPLRCSYGLIVLMMLVCSSGLALLVPSLALRVVAEVMWSAYQRRVVWPVVSSVVRLCVMYLACGSLLSPMIVLMAHEPIDPPFDALMRVSTLGLFLGLVVLVTSDDCPLPQGSETTAQER